MNRFDHLGPALPARRRLPTAIAVDDRIRGPLAALAAIVVLTICLGAVQYERLLEARRAYEATAARLATQTSSLAALRAVRERVETQTRIAEAVADARRASLARAAELVWIGDHLPSDTWLRALRYDAGGYALEGTADRTAAVGTALLALHDPARAATPRLVSLRDDTAGGPAHVHYTLQLSVSP